MAGVESTERWQTNIRSLKEGISHIYETKEFADVTFTVSTRTFKGHRLILGARSPKLAKMLLKENFNYPEETNIILNDVSEDGFENLLHYIYTDELKEDSDLPSTYRAAQVFEQKGLLCKCTDMLARWEITIDNVCKILNESWDISILRKSCTDFLKKNTTSVLTTEEFLEISDEILRALFEMDYFKHVPTMILLENIMRWGKHQFPPQDNYKLVRELLLQTDKPLLGKLGIEKLTSDELARIISDYKDLLTVEESMKFFVHAHKRNTELPDWCCKEKE